MQVFQEILNLHRADFPPSRRPVVPAPSIDENGIRTRHENAALAGIGLFKREQRTAAKHQAQAWAEYEISTERTRLAQQQAYLQGQLDERWQQLCANEPAVVLATLEEAFEDNEAPAAAVGLHADELALVVLSPPMEIVPERMPATTQAGNLTLRKLPKKERVSFYKLLVCGHLLATLREAFAVAPSLRSARVVVLRSAGPDSYGNPRVECILAAHFFRKAFDGIRWDAAEASDVVNDTASELLIKERGAAKEFDSIDLSNESELATLIEQVDVSELVTARP